MRPNFLITLIGTTFFTGYIPIAPGTFASILALPFVILLYKNTIIFLLICLVLLIVGVLCANYLAKYYRKKDDQRVTIDEFLGILISFMLLPKLNWYLIIIGFILFRAFDILKIFGIRQVESMSGGWGVMLDDVLSGIYTNLILRLILLIV